MIKSPPELAISVRPNKASAKYSGAWNFSANRARNGDTNIRQMPDSRPPITDATSATVIALPAFPACASG